LLLFNLNPAFYATIWLKISLNIVTLSAGITLFGSGKEESVSLNFLGKYVILNNLEQER